MASRLPSASTRKKAQVIVTCQLCQRSSPLKWKCNDCDILMCDNCKTNVHARVKTATRHTIVDIKDIDFSESKEPSVDLDNIPCKTHPTQSCCVYCLQCKELICPKCLKTHKGHDVEEIETQYIQNLEYFRKNVSGNIDPHDLTSIFGSLNKLSMQNIITNPEKINLTKTNTFEVNLPYVQSIVATSVNSVWITCMQTRTLQEMKIEQTLKSLREYNDKSIYAMAISRTGDLLLTLAEDSHLYRLDETGMIDVVHDFSPLLPKAIHTNGNSIIVSTREKGDVFPITKHSRRQIVVLAQTEIIEYDKQNKRLFSLIGRLTMNKTGHIFGIDCLSFDLRRIVKVDNNSIEWIYEGNSHINTEFNFCPLSLTTTQYGNIIVADKDNHSLHILSGEGVLIKCCMMKDLNILHPASLDIDLNGNLWIGCDKNTNSNKKVKIHKLAISGC